jgi:Multiubiquitin
MTEHPQTSDTEEILDTVVDIEECSRTGRKPPRARHYRLRIDKKPYVVDTPHLTGRALLELAGKTPPEKWILRQIFRNGPAVPIGLDQKVDLTTQGVEKFSTMPKDISDGAR